MRRELADVRMEREILNEAAAYFAEESLHGTERLLCLAEAKTPHFKPRREEKLKVAIRAAHDYRQLIEQFGMTPSMSRPGNRYGNAPMESFWGSMKSELIHHFRYESRAEAEASIREYIEIFYNRKRRHSRLGDLARAVFAQNFIGGHPVA